MKDRKESRLKAWPVALLYAFASAGVKPAHAAGPMYYLQSFGSRGSTIVSLTWGLFILSIVVVVVISVLVIGGVFSRRDPTPRTIGMLIPVMRGEGSLPWIYGGLILTAVILAAFVIWTVAAMASISAPPTKPRVSIDIIGHQWWWELRYHDGDISRSFTSANEIHIPVGQPVGLKLTSSDVIHSFWVPALSGKTDLIPGRTNDTWIEADKSGIYRGQCSEYCGQEHAHMAIKLIADPPDKFKQWWADQLQPAAAPTGKQEKAGEQQVLIRCGICHTVRGTPAGGQVGPDLTHLMSRTTIAANTLPNTPGYLSGWIADPQHVKPGNRMPRLGLSGSDLAAIRSYLLTLK
jgi:cytochrome c oxidase subunit 2